jgi:hypothetical protein
MVPHERTQRRAIRPVAIALGATVVSLTFGCTSGPLATRNPTVGSLKSEVAQLQAEKDQLKRELTNAKADNREIHSQLVQAEESNNDLSTRLANVKGLLRRQDGDLAGPGRGGEPALEPRTTPARNSRKARTSPITEIPGQIEVPVPDSNDDADDRPPARRRDDPEAQSRVDDHRWLPMVARGISSPTKPR